MACQRQLAAKAAGQESGHIRTGGHEVRRAVKVSAKLAASSLQVGNSTTRRQPGDRGSEAKPLPIDNQAPAQRRNPAKRAVTRPAALSGFSVEVPTKRSKPPQRRRIVRPVKLEGFTNEYPAPPPRITVKLHSPHSTAPLVKLEEPVISEPRQSEPNLSPKSCGSLCKPVFLSLFVCRLQGPRRAAAAQTWYVCG